MTGAIITEAINHFDRWWLIGTDYTRDWVPYGVLWTADEVDITNYYLRMGVNGGLVLMLLFIAILLTAFHLLGKRMRAMRESVDPSEFLLWSVGAALLPIPLLFCP